MFWKILLFYLVNKFSRNFKKSIFFLSCSVFSRFCKVKYKDVRKFSVVPYPVIFFLSIFWALKRGGNYQILWMKFAFYHQNFFFWKRKLVETSKRPFSNFKITTLSTLVNVQRLCCSTLTFRILHFEM